MWRVSQNRCIPKSLIVGIFHEHTMKHHEHIVNISLDIMKYLENRPSSYLMGYHVVHRLRGTGLASLRSQHGGTGSTAGLATRLGFSATGDVLWDMYILYSGYNMWCQS